MSLGGMVALGAVLVALLVSHNPDSATPSAAEDSIGADASGAFGTALNKPVPEGLLRIPLTDQHGTRVSLASWPGKTVLLVPFLSLCSDICPMTTGNLLQVEESLAADHASANVQIVELSVDPERDSPARLAAYTKLTGAHWELVTESPTVLATLARFFGFTYEKVPEDKPASIDWWTGKPLTYDVDHSDEYFVIDPGGHERVVNDAAPDFHGRLNPELYKFLSGEGHQHLEHPEHPNWNPADVLRALSLVLHHNLAVAPVE